MRSMRLRLLFLSALILGISFANFSLAQHKNPLFDGENFTASPSSSLSAFSPVMFDRYETAIVKTPSDGGVREEIPKKYREKYQKWKAEFLSTEFGRRQWESYAGNKQFILTVKVSGEFGEGAKTDEYLWDEAGNFVGATITLGSKSDKGFPDPVYYPVMNSLSTRSSIHWIDGDVLAATKLAHEIGHVNQTFKENKEIFLLRSKLMPVYISFFLKNGYNPRDRYLLDLADKMGGTPLKIWENREYWSEVNALFYLNEKINGEAFYCRVFDKIRRNIEQYAKNYEERFDLAKTSNCDK